MTEFDSSRFTEQYAIRLPNGMLHSHTPMKWVIKDGIIAYLPGEDVEPEPVVYDTMEEAEESISRFQATAAHMGITEWLGHIETRYCTPFSHTEPSAEMVADLERWLGDAAGES